MQCSTSLFSPLTLLAWMPRSWHGCFGKQRNCQATDARLLHRTPPPRLSALIPKRLYKRLCHRALGAAASGTDSGSKGRNGRAAVTWGDITDANIEALIATFTSAEVNVDGKATYKDEFVTAGGKSRVRLCVHVGVRVCLCNDAKQVNAF